ncbi:NAD(P)/FAD-dependent oxidoreductase [Leisingera caerulea]|uniref:NAD(P)/FAD-dependent oxidoreductase n=1 Tax=Leisingera caerulea TaxID=506591 RepID=UPI0021A4D81B|nr:FAD-dependent oxidoreductase [Leisingera caerulea]UWQ85996.1 FAD-binding oxidoreductase [Leisingera caerulea]
MTTGTSEITIIGGGVVGLSIALGLLQAGRRVTVLDGSDEDFRASQGNFGLVWLQGKGSDFAPYAEWTRDAVAAWPGFAAMLGEYSCSDLALDQPGGFEFFTDPAEFEDFAAALKRQQTHLGNGFSHEVIHGDDLRRSHPEIGPDVAGATFSALDGHVNPLRLLRALRSTVLQLGGQIRSDAQVTAIAPAPGGGFKMSLRNGGQCGTERVVLTAGLGNTPLAAQLGFVTRVRPQRGELLITEKLADRLPFLSSTIRQVDEGGVQIGGTKAEAGPDDSETLDVVAGLAQHAVTVLPALADVRVVRAWGALRVMSPDGYPVYARSPRHPGAYLVTCHSGVTLAPLHAGVLAEWIDDTSNAPDLEAFDENRFAISDAA